MILKNQILTMQFVGVAICVVYLLIGGRAFSREIDFSAAYSPGKELVLVPDSLEEDASEEVLSTDYEVEDAIEVSAGRQGGARARRARR